MEGLMAAGIMAIGRTLTEPEARINYALLELLIYAFHIVRP